MKHIHSSHFISLGTIRRLFQFCLSCCLAISCANNDVTDIPGTGFVTVISEDCPRQKSTTQFGGHLSQTEYSTISYIDADGDLVQYEPRSSGRDTITIPTYNGYAEIMHLYKAIEFDTFLLKDGDTVYVRYDSLNRPHITSSKSDLYTELYNLPYSIDGAIQSKGYHIRTILTNPQFAGPYKYFKNKEMQQKYPSLMHKFKDRYVDLDSLAQVYQDYVLLLNYKIDSLSTEYAIEPAYTDYLRRTALIEETIAPQDVVQSDSMLHYISNYVIAQKYREGKDATILFDEIAKDTITTELAKRGILKRLAERIASGESGWHIYPKSIVEHYLSEYSAITGDSSFEHGKKDCLARAETIKPASSTLIEDEEGQLLSLDRLLESNRGKILYIDIWASWCVPCRAQMPFSQKLQKQLENDNIAFLFLSIDTNSKSWQDAIAEEASTMKKSYRFVDADNDFIRQMDINKIPRYIIIDADGNIIDPDAGRPSSHTIENELKRLSNAH